MLSSRVNFIVDEIRTASTAGYSERHDAYRKAVDAARALCRKLSRAEAREARPALFSILEMPLTGTCAPECCDASWIRAIQIAAKCEMLTKWRSVDPEAANMLSPQLVAALVVPHSKRIALAAVELIERSPEASQRYIDVMNRALEHPQWQVAECAARTLGKMGLAAKHKSLEGLTKQLRHTQWQVRKAAAKALGRMIEGKYKPLAHTVEHDNHPAVRYAASKVLGLKYLEKER